MGLSLAALAFVEDVTAGTIKTAKLKEMIKAIGNFRKAASRLASWLRKHHLGIVASGLIKLVSPLAAALMDQYRRI